MGRMAVVVVVLGLSLAGCGAETSVAVQNESDTATKTTVRDSTNTLRVDFAELAPGARSAFVVVDWPSYSGVNVDASDNHENGTVTLTEGRKNVVQVWRDGKEPTVMLEE